jgi:hypothetical protein
MMRTRRERARSRGDVAEESRSDDMPSTRSASAKFEAIVMSGHKEAAVEVPFDPAARWSLEAKPLWSGRRGHAVRGKLDGVRFESFVVPRSNRFWMLIDAELLESARIEEGDSVAVEIEPMSPGVATKDDGSRAKKKAGASRRTSRGANPGASARATDEAKQAPARVPAARAASRKRKRSR